MIKHLLSLTLLLSVAVNGNAQKNLAAKDSIRIFYSQLFDNLKADFIDKNEVSWEEVIEETNQKLSKYESLSPSLAEIQPLFDKLGATHCNVYYNNKTYTSTKKSIKEKLTQQWKTRYAAQPAFEAKVLNNDFGYILIPKIIFSDISAKNIHRVAQPLYDEIADIKSKNKLKGWIIDLRLNTGGNSFAMLLALYDLLGDSKVAGSLNVHGIQTNTVRLENGMYFDNEHKISFINRKGDLLNREKVAIITGPATASSGEMVAASFKGRENTIFIGQETYGATTGNIKADLPFGAFMALTNSYNCDRYGKYHKTILPDITILNQDNFDDLLLDQNIQEAIKFITE